MTDANTPKVAILMGSDSDWPVMQNCVKQLHDFGLEPVVRVISAHRTPDIAADFARKAEENGIRVIIAAAGMAAHLAGAMAAHTHLPIIGVPLVASEGPGGMDALLSTVNMPPGLPVATVSLATAGAKNAAILAVQMLALGDAVLREKLVTFRKAQTKKVVEKDVDLQTRLQAMTKPAPEVPNKS